MGQVTIEFEPESFELPPCPTSVGTLLLSSTKDTASMNILSEVLKIEGWGEERDFPHGLVTIHEEFEVQILLIDNLHILADGIDKEHRESTGFPVNEVLVLSKHASASKVPALTLHAIGVPGETPHGERGRSGGIKGKAVPPSTRFGDMFRTMKKIAIEASLDKEYDITLEATHHGPLLDSPTLYLEIGSD